MALMNRALNDDIVTLFMMPHERYTHISSSLIKEVSLLGGDISSYVPNFVSDALRGKFE
jgi:pantetheine-phosphate adenylyltransferase